MKFREKRPKNKYSQAKEPKENWCVCMYVPDPNTNTTIKIENIEIMQLA